jgi:hypothetical protein
MDLFSISQISWINDYFKDKSCQSDYDCNNYKKALTHACAIWALTPCPLSSSDFTNLAEKPELYKKTEKML